MAEWLHPHRLNHSAKTWFPMGLQGYEWTGCPAADGAPGNEHDYGQYDYPEGGDSSYAKRYEDVCRQCGKPITDEERAL